ncbi:uncharacterized protein LOC117802810 [Ailuropoda melanoleuca]|uniref:uncharacterized protein LOC117802810 n=1 Tax=Ailuropoda melanoleuca TaxID=9646 RepID=UPI0014944491|nr:uncharacterized protein LOC117802810 [Ailuropoda melanoleuca]
MVFKELTTYSPVCGLLLYRPQARRPRVTPGGPPSHPVPGALLSRPHQPPATSSGCSCGSPPPTRVAPTRARTLAPAPGRGSSGSSAAGRTRRGAELWGGGGPGPAPAGSGPPLPAALTIPAVQFGGPGGSHDRTRRGLKPSPEPRALRPRHVTAYHVTRLARDRMCGDTGKKPRSRTRELSLKACSWRKVEAGRKRGCRRQRALMAGLPWSRRAQAVAAERTATPARLKRVPPEGTCGTRLVASAVGRRGRRESFPGCVSSCCISTALRCWVRALALKASPVGKPWFF